MHTPSAIDQAPASGVRQSTPSNPRVAHWDAPNHLTFGDLVTSLFASCPPQRAEHLLQFAVNTRLVRFAGAQQIVIADAPESPPHPHRKGEAPAPANDDEWTSPAHARTAPVAGPARADRYSVSSRA